MGLNMINIVCIIYLEQVEGFSSYFQGILFRTTLRAD